jgi:hypothetical protein
MGWDWLSAWWDVFGASSGATWVCIVCEDEAGVVQAIAPLGLRRAAVRGPLWTRRLSLLGGFFVGEGIHRQYPQLLGAFDRHPELLTATLDRLSERGDWGELALVSVPRANAWFEPLAREATSRGWHLRTTDNVPSHVIDMRGTFEDYLARLGASARRRLVHQRKRLAAIGPVSLAYADPSNAAEALDVLNTLRAESVGTPAFGGRALAFHLRLIAGLSDPASLRLSTLSVAGEPQSVNYALRAGGRQYGMAMGRHPRFDRKVSLGTLHLGYELEAAWADGVERYDLMTSRAGEEGWKQELGASPAELIDVRVVRQPLLAAAYRLHDRISAFGRWRAGRVVAPSR